ncbi:MAG: 4Fe-4S dicluster domain-containing protein [Phycisphaerales bacterium]|nr:4Fe-4S dicluster domain-containing protein [Phycisphaerales bacterium]MCB9854367.1 4Fe-4S dicluster domain-containing protein [Phycisphaerales bacterium]MCB9863568.1 4Fe-4S dicluster domain-containing protein [Phycisphaerales bacterium]
MQHPPVNSKPRSLGRVLCAIFFGHPQVIVLVPLSIGILVHAIVRLTHEEPTHGFTPAELVRCAGVLTALTMFAGLSIFYLVIVIMGILQKSGNGNSVTATRSTTEGLRLDCIITRKFLLERIAELGKSRTLIGPVARSDSHGHAPQHFYEVVKRPDEIALDFGYCVYGPKGVLLPARETLLQFDRVDGQFKARACIDDRPTAIVGVHPCDLHAIETLDVVFRDGPSDTHYLTRRENTFIVGIDCARPCTDGVFCGDIGTNLAAGGFDVMLYPLFDVVDASALRGFKCVGPESNGRCLGAMFGTEAGRRWFEGGPKEDFYIPEGKDIEIFDAYLDQKREAFPQEIEADWKDVPRILGRSYDSLLWKATSNRCYSCGSCNLVCPTCYCFDIQDENDLPVESGRRERTWDGCMLREFASVAGGHNFRDASANRLRHRILRKGAWIQQQTGHHGCVGCGRCDRACTAQISIKQIMNQLAEEARHAGN